MGIFSSKPYHTDPSAFATKVEPSTSSALVTVKEALEKYKSYDYIIVGAGMLKDNSCIKQH
jgi:hypothetical protein